MSNGADADASDALYAKLAVLSGPDLVAHLTVTCRKADYAAVARVLGDRDRRLAHAEAVVQTELPNMAAQVQALQERYLEAERRRGASRASSGGAPAIAAPWVGRRRAEGPGPDGVIVLCGSSDDDDDDEMEEGEFRPAVARVSCKRKETASSEGDGGRRAGVSCKKDAPAPACSPDDEDDEIPLSQLFKKRRRADPGANGKPKKGHRDALVNSAGPLGVDRPVISPVNRGIPEAAVAEHMIGDDPEVTVLVQGSGSGQSGKNGGLSRTMPSPPPTGSTAGHSMQKNCSKPDGSEGRDRIGEKQGPVADAPVQVRTPSLSDTVRRIVGSSRVGAETPMDHPGSSSQGTIKGQEKPIGGVHKTKVPLETDGTGEKASMAMRGTTEHGKPDGQVVMTKVLPTANRVGEQGGKLSPCQSREDTHGHGGRPTTSDKPVSATLQPQNQLALHSEQMKVESSLPSPVYNWESSSQLLFSCIQDKEICMQAACALHRQRKFTTEGRRSGLSKFDVHRAAVLVEFLLDGNLQGPLKRTAEDLEKHDSEGHDLLERVVLQCSEQLFGIYSNKEDKYFR